ncbi:hypothetical protein PENOC_105170 [Penicillium occitanis (nom. inval.)]|nr:hypothetical protein PENOC_105170 [Penicillium occitanis (nom. inval.)]
MEPFLFTDTELQFSVGQVLCLHGQHRVRAGAEVLLEEDRWWTVDLYLDDISTELRTTLIEEYANKRQPNDREIYRKIRQYQQEHNAHFQRRWWVRLSLSKARRLQQLHKNIDIQCAFDALLPISGVWDGMSIGKLSKVMALDSDKEVLNYLSHIKKFWVKLVSVDAAHPNLAAMRKIDSHTVKKLESMAPGGSRVDARTVRGWMISGEVLGEFSETERSNIDNVNHLELAYRQVWLYAMRHYPSMSKDPESDDLLTRPASEKADETVVYEMAVLAQKLGFMSAGIEEIINQSPD